MTSPLHIVQVQLEECWLDLPLLCRLTGVTEDWLREHVALGLLRERAPVAAGAWRFDAADLRRVQRMAALERHFDAVPELAALVADLEDELARLRAQQDARSLG